MLVRLPHRVAVQSVTLTEFEGGAYTTSWTTISTEWANVQLQGYKSSMKETYKTEKKQQYTYFNVTMRRSVAVTNENRLIFDGDILVIEATGDPTSDERLKLLKCRKEHT